MTPAGPPRTVAPTSDSATVARLSSGLAAAEQSFSDEAQRIGPGAAFAKYGSADAANMGSGATFTFGADAIGRAVGAGTSDTSSPVSWSADRTLVASSGDLGVTFGMIRNNADPSRPPAPFVTIGRRASPHDPWRYIAE